MVLHNDVYHFKNLNSRLWFLLSLYFSQTNVDQQVHIIDVEKLLGNLFLENDVNSLKTLIEAVIVAAIGKMQEFFSIKTFMLDKFHKDKINIGFSNLEKFLGGACFFKLLKSFFMRGADNHKDTYQSVLSHFFSNELQ